MATYVALLRGVNVGGKSAVPMARLRALFEDLGATDVRTYIQSGNVVYTGAKPLAAATVEAAIANEFGVDSAVVQRTGTELAKVLTANPFIDADLSKVHVGFAVKKPAGASIDAARFAPEEYALRGTEVYLHLPNGMGRSKLPAFVLPKLKVPVTVRNWNTVTKLADLARL